MPCKPIQRKLCTDYNRSFASHPKSKYWSDANECKPDEIFKSTKNDFFFDCNCGHVFIMPLSKITNSKRWCQYCGHNQLCEDLDCDICFKNSFASHPKAKYWSDANGCNPRFVFKSAHSEFLFDCKCGHVFAIKPNKITNSYRWCQYCGHDKLCEDLDCEMCHQHSFASHEGAKYWSNDNEIEARFVFKKSHTKYKFDCKCGHSFNREPKTMGANACTYCNNQKLCEDLNCETCFEKSFASHPKSKYWSKNNNLQPRFIFKKSGQKFEFDCKCGHSFLKEIKLITKRNSWCPYCVNQKLCNDLNCEMCFNNSFAFHPASKYWSKTNKIKPRFVFKKSGKKYKFKCEYDHYFDGSPNNIVSNSMWCAKCKKKTEVKLLEWLKILEYDISYQPEYEWCKMINRLPYDFAIEKLKIIIELDGKQHFEKVDKWQDPKITQKRDLFKMKQAVLNGYTVIRLLQTDVWKDKYDWKKKLSKYIHKYDEPECIFLSKGDEYKCFEKKLYNGKNRNNKNLS